jgi:hypothetical protein
MLGNIIKNNILDYISDMNSIYNKNFFVVKEQVKNLYSKLELVKDIKEGDKISFDVSNNIYIDKCYRLQFIKRWFYNEDRIKTYKSLRQIFLLYNSSIKNLINVLHKINYNIIDVYFLRELISWNTGLINGMQNLYNTYNNKLDDIKCDKEKYNTRALLELIKGINDILYINNTQLKKLSK